MHVNEKQAEKHHYCKCKYCSRLIGEVRTKQHLIRSWEKKSNIKLTYLKKNDTLYIQTEVGFWKIFLREDKGGYMLYHLNSFDKDSSFENLIYGGFHRQKDVKAANDIDTLVTYIVEHDCAKVIIMDSYKKLPKSTKRQRKYYQQAERRARKNEYRRLNSLFEMLESQNPGYRELAIM